MNSVILMGRLTADPELKTTQSGIEVVSFCIAVDRPTSKDSEKQADFINCVAWRQTAAFLSTYFKKGMKLAVEGSLQARKWDDKDGNKRVSYEVIINRAHFCERKQDGAGQPAPSYANGDYASITSNPAPNYTITTGNPTPNYAPTTSGQPAPGMEVLGDEELPF